MKKGQKIPIIFENDDILVIDKPSGLSVHGDGRKEEYTVSDWILENYEEIKNVGEPLILEDGKQILRPGIVHRLDKDTSGVMVVAKNERVFQLLKGQFQDRKIHKVYRAIAFGKFKDDNGIIDKPIGRSGTDFRAKNTGRYARGEMREALTYYKVLERLGDYTFLELRPKTGRTHQIRVHLKSISRPIVCDIIYAKSMKCPSWMGRLALHAYSLEITLPGGEKKTFISQLPKDFETALDKIRRL
ncbi:MAG: Pseudouridine synthase, RluA family [Parcubacteria group bacterium GW2011_GWF2_38_76]|nr:MAG: Pseudouridine synthase, RluA family [Parcubacteria group bacterium GW2011_GWF2_38_76]HBM45558.1 RluA family pseudouridine synthase [Patescibacteria group bacterium]